MILATATCCPNYAGLFRFGFKSKLAITVKKYINLVEVLGRVAGTISFRDTALNEFGVGEGPRTYIGIITINQSPFNQALKQI